MNVLLQKIRFDQAENEPSKVVRMAAAREPCFFLVSVPGKDWCQRGGMKSRFTVSIQTAPPRNAKLIVEIQTCLEF